MSKLKLVVTLCLTVSTAAFATDFYVSPQGSSANSGSINSPWDLATALAAPAVVKPGDTIWLRGGMYGPGGRYYFNSYLTGTASAPIIVRQYPGERASINAGIQVLGPYSWFWGFEILNTSTSRVSSQSGSFPTDIALITGIIPVNDANHPTLPGIKFINIVSHDTSNGFSSFSGAPGTEIYGCLSYNNGWIGTDRGHGHGIYIQNTSDLKLIAENLIFNNFDAGLHPSGTSAAAIQNISMIGNVVFNNGQAGGHRVDNIIVEGGGVPKRGIVVDSNYAYNPKAPVGNTGYNRVGWQFDGVNGDLVFSNNVWVGGDPGMMVSNWTTVKATNNIFYAQTDDTSNYSGELQVNLLSGQNFSQYAWDNNTYYASGWRQIVYHLNGYNVYTGGLAGWQSASGLDAHSQAIGSAPTGVWTYVRPNKYERGRANIIIYNWNLAPSVTVNISAAGLPVGQPFEIRDAQNFFGAPVATGTYTGASVVIPMSGLTIAQPIGAPVQIQHTAPQFAAFVVLPTGTVPASSVAVSVSPTSATLGPGKTQQFQAAVTGTTNTGVVWTISPSLGAISTSGLYTAPSSITSQQTVTVTATSQADGSKSAAAHVTLNPPLSVTTPPSVQITAPGAFATVSGTVNVSASATAGSWPIAGVQFKLDGVNLGSQDTIAPYQVAWDTTTTTSTNHILTAVVRDTAGNQVTSPSVTVKVSNPTSTTTGTFALRVDAGGTLYIDHLGRTWSGDNGFTGGTAWMSGGVINNTLDKTLYLSQRYGSNFSYKFPVPNGTYTVTLKFAEMVYTQRGARQFNAAINGQQVLSNFDVVAAAGAAVTAIDKSFPVSVANGQIVIQFSTGASSVPIVNAIEILGSSTNTTAVPPSVQISSPAAGATVSGNVSVAAMAKAGSSPIGGVQFKLDGANLGSEVTVAPYQTSWSTTNTTDGTHTLTATVIDTAGVSATSAPVSVTVKNGSTSPTTTTFTPIRVNVGGSSYIDSSGVSWAADEGFTGGTSWMSGGVINNTLDKTLYLSQRYGSSFSYKFAVPNGNYTVTLKFAEMVYTQRGAREFNAAINGQQVLSNFDVVAEAGAAVTAIDKSFPVSVTNGQIQIQFSTGASAVPIINCIAIQ